MENDSCMGRAMGRDAAVPPLPDYGEGGPVNGSSTPSIPLPDYGEGGAVNGGSSTPSVPLPDYGEGGPVNGGSSTPSIPLPDYGEGGPVANPPASPSVRYAYVRFINGVSNAGAFRITVGARLVASRLSPGSLTGYYAIPAGFRTVTLYDPQFPWVVLFRMNFPFTGGQVSTIAIVRSGGTYDLMEISDMPCGNRGMNRACIRTVNLAYNSPGIDVVLTDGRVLFTDVRFKEVTAYRRARPGQYDLYIARTPYQLPSAYTDIETVEEMPVAINDYYLPGYGAVEPLSSFYVDARAGAMETIYLLGNWNISHALRVKVVENY